MNLKNKKDIENYLDKMLNNKSLKSISINFFKKNYKGTFNDVIEVLEDYKQNNKLKFKYRLFCDNCHHYYVVLDNECDNLNEDEECLYCGEEMNNDADRELLIVKFNL